MVRHVGAARPSSTGGRAPPRSSSGSPQVLPGVGLNHMPIGKRLRSPDDDRVGIEAAVGPTVSCPGPSMAHLAPVSRRSGRRHDWCWPEPSRSRDITKSPVPAAMVFSGSSPAGQCNMVTRPLLGQSVRTWWSLGRWHGPSGPAPGAGPGQAPGSPDPTGAAGPAGSHSQESSQAWMAALTTQPMAPAVPPVRNTSARQSPPVRESPLLRILSPSRASQLPHRALRALCGD